MTNIFFIVRTETKLIPYRNSGNTENAQFYNLCILSVTCFQTGAYTKSSLKHTATNSLQQSYICL